MEITLLLQGGLNGVMLGLNYGLIALGLSLIFGIMGIVNFAHGEMYMLGGYVAYYLVGRFHLNFLTTMIAGVVIVGLVDVVARPGGPADARVHVEAEDDVVVVVGRTLVRDVVVPEDDVARLGIGPLESAHLDAQAEPQARAVPAVGPKIPGVEVLVANPERRLKPGFYANGAVVTRTDDRALMIPQDALITFAGVTKVFVVHDGVARQREVRPGSRGTGGLVEITEGLAPDEQVATSALNRLEDGAAVTVRTADANVTPTPP